MFESYSRKLVAATGSTGFVGSRYLLGRRVGAPSPQALIRMLPTLFSAVPSDLSLLMRCSLCVSATRSSASLPPQRNPEIGTVLSKLTYAATSSESAAYRLVCATNFSAGQSISSMMSSNFTFRPLSIHPGPAASMHALSTA